MGLRDRLIHAWNAFRSEETTTSFAVSSEIGPANSVRSDRTRLRLGNEGTIIASIYNRIANDCASITIEHARMDQNGKFMGVIKSGLNECLTLSSNIDQTSREFILDVVLSMLDEGHVAIIPVDTTINLLDNGSFDIESMRTGRVTQWMPRHVICDVYNDRTGKHEELTLPKDKVAIVENPFYSVMNAPNSTLKRLIYKLRLLDSVDENNGNAKLDLIIQLPYTIRSEARQQQAENRRQRIVEQLNSSDYGIAYIDATEHITQLNRAVESNLLPQIEYLTKQLYSQLGIGESIFSGVANEAEMLNYYNQVIEPIMSSITLEMTRKFLTKTGRTQGQRISYFRDPFRLVPVNQLAEIADKFTRNEILSSNEVRAVIGMPASADERADQLLNKNIAVKNQPGSDTGLPAMAPTDEGVVDETDQMDPRSVRVSDLE